MLLGLVNCLLAYLLGRALLGRATGLILALFMSLYWMFIYFEGKLQAPVLLVFLALCLMHCCRFLCRRFTFPRAAATGLCMGLFAIVRPNVLLFLPVLIVWGWWILRKEQHRRTILTMIAGLVLGIAVPIAPVTLRNYMVSKELVLISANAGVNLYIGNNESANGRFLDDISELGHFRTCFDYSTTIEGLEKKLGHDLNYSEVSRYFTSRAVDFIKHHPITFLKLTARKAILFWTPNEITHNNAVKYDRHFSKVLSRIPGNFAVVLSLALVGAALLALDIRKAQPASKETAAMSILMALFILTYFASFLPFFITSLYRVPITPFLLLFGAYGLLRTGKYAASHAFGKAVLCTAAWLVLLTLLSLPLIMRSNASDNADLARWHFAQGVSYKLSGKPDAAIAAYQKAIAASPSNARAHNNLALLLKDQGRIDQAIAHYEIALKSNPHFEEAHCGMAELYSTLGRFDEAISHYSEALRIRPDYHDARFVMANTLAMQGRFEEAVAQYRLVIQARPDFAPGHTNIGVVLASMPGRLDEAIAHYHKALAIQPLDHAIHCNLGIALALSGRANEAENSFRRALELKPDYEPARQRLAQLLGEG
jgi:tetratricopeptide (TPR) repeat protein